MNFLTSRIPLDRGTILLMKFIFFVKVRNHKGKHSETASLSLYSALENLRAAYETSFTHYVEQRSPY
jgi:hypothetical protein